MPEYFDISATKEDAQRLSRLIKQTPVTGDRAAVPGASDESDDIIIVELQANLPEQDYSPQTVLHVEWNGTEWAVIEQTEIIKLVFPGVWGGQRPEWPQRVAAVRLGDLGYCLTYVPRQRYWAVLNEDLTGATDGMDDPSTAMMHLIRKSQSTGLRGRHGKEVELTHYYEGIEIDQDTLIRVEWDSDAFTLIASDCDPMASPPEVS